MSASFLDSSILLYLLDERDQHKFAIAENLVKEALRTKNAVISFQVVQETLNVATRKLEVPLRPDEASTFLDKTLLPLWKVNPSRQLYRGGLDIQSRYRFSLCDSLIIAAALEAGCAKLYSEDLQHGQRIERLRIVNPFLE